MSEYSREWFRPGPSARDLPRSYGVAITDWQSVGGYGGAIMASPGSSVGSFSACRTEPGASGYDPQIS